MTNGRGGGRGPAALIAVAILLAPLWVWAEAPGSQSGESPPEPSEGGSPGDGPSRRPVPEGFVEMGVLTVATTEMGNVVVLADRLQSVVVPIWVGETEALAIALRLEGEGFRRPLTHDLIDALLREFGAELVEVRIDALQDSTFVASLFIAHNDREILLDARASDSIALALGSGVPIFVSVGVIEQTGIRPSELGVPPLAPSESAPGGVQPPQGDVPL